VPNFFQNHLPDYLPHSFSTFYWMPKAMHRLPPNFFSILLIFYYCCTGSSTLWHLKNFLFCYAGKGYIVVFTKVLTIYKIYYTWIHSLHHSPLFPPPTYSWNSFNMSLFSFYIHVYTAFVLYSLSYTLSPHLPPSHWYHHSLTGRTCSVSPPVLQFVKEKKWHFCLR
jgi:hypothetical protein